MYKNIDPVPQSPVTSGTRIGHVHLKVADIGRALEFYVGVLGFSVKQRYGEQAAFIAGLPQAPSVYDVYTNREVALDRQKYVVQLMYQTSLEQNCIYVSNSPQAVCVDLDTGSAAAYSLENFEFHQPDINIRYPHWVNYVHSILEEQFDPQTIYRSGFTVETTLDPALQEMAQAALKKHISLLEANQVQSGALVAIEPSTAIQLRSAPPVSVTIARFSEPLVTDRPTSPGVRVFEASSVPPLPANRFTSDSVSVRSEAAVRLWSPATTRRCRAPVGTT